LDSIVVAGIVRTIYLNLATGPKPDKSWNIFSVWAASLAEANLGIMCACAPSLKSVFGKFFHDLKSSKTNSKESSEKKSGNFDSETNDKMGMYFDSRITEETTIDTETMISDSTSSWYTKIPFGASRKSGQHAGQELTSFADAHEYGIQSDFKLVEGYEDDSSARLGAPGSTDDEVPLRPTIFRYNYAHEDPITTSSTTPASKYSNKHSGEPVAPLPGKIAGAPGLLNGTEDARHEAHEAHEAQEDNFVKRNRINSMPSNPAGFEAVQFSPSPTGYNQDGEEDDAAATSSKPRRGSIRQALLNLKNPAAQQNVSPTHEVLPRTLGFRQQSSMPNFHNNGISHILDPSECGSSASSICDKATENRVEQGHTQYGTTYVPGPAAPPILTPRGYPAAQPAVMIDSASPVLSPRGYQATRPTRGSSTSKPVMNLSSNATSPSE
jgi:hypothetical protein